MQIIPSQFTHRKPISWGAVAKYYSTCTVKEEENHYNVKHHSWALLRQCRQNPLPTWFYVVISGLLSRWSVVVVVVVKCPTNRARPDQKAGKFGCMHVQPILRQQFSQCKYCKKSLQQQIDSVQHCTSRLHRSFEQTPGIWSSSHPPSSFFSLSLLLTTFFPPVFFAASIFITSP